MLKIIPSGAKTNFIPLPFSLLIYKRAVKANIQGELIKSLHFIDLQCLILSLEIDSLNQYIRDLAQVNLNKRGIKEVRQATEEDYENL